jgi:hypothetical protein
MAMSTLGLLKSEGGFTIQELLVAIIAGSLLVGISFTLYLFVARIVQKDFRGREHRQNALRTVELIASDIERSSHVMYLTESTLALESALHGSTIYCMKQGNLFRGTVSVGPPEGERWSVILHGSSRGTISIALKSYWGKDSVQAGTIVSIPASSAVEFSSSPERALH